jgi:hypothetical protein
MPTITPVLRPLNIADLIDASVRLYRANFTSFLGITAVVYGPLAAVQIVFAFFAANWAEKGALDKVDDPLAMLTMLSPLLLVGGVFGLLTLLLVPLGQGALTAAVSHRYLGRTLTVTEAYEALKDCWGSLIGATILVGLLTAVGMMLCIIPGIYIAVTLMLVAPVIVLEGATVNNSFARSRWLVQGEWWHCFGTIVLLSLIVGIVASAVSWPISMIAALLLQDHPALGQALSQGVGAVAGLIVQPVQIIGLVLLYYDLRIRKEGFDLKLLAESLGEEAPVMPAKLELPPPPPPPPYAR